MLCVLTNLIVCRKEFCVSNEWEWDWVLEVKAKMSPNFGLQSSFIRFFWSKFIRLHLTQIQVNFVIWNSTKIKKFSYKSHFVSWNFYLVVSRLVDFCSVLAVEVKYTLFIKAGIFDWNKLHKFVFLRITKFQVVDKKQLNLLTVEFLSKLHRITSVCLLCS